MNRNWINSQVLILQTKTLLRPICLLCDCFWLELFLRNISHFFSLSIALDRWWKKRKGISLKIVYQKVRKRFEELSDHQIQISQSSSTLTNGVYLRLIHNIKKPFILKKKRYVQLCSCCIVCMVSIKRKDGVYMFLCNSIPLIKYFNINIPKHFPVSLNT